MNLEKNIIYLFISYIVLYLTANLAYLLEKVYLGSEVNWQNFYSNLNPFKVEINMMIVAYSLFLFPFYIIYKFFNKKNNKSLYQKYLLWSVVYCLLISFILILMAGGSINFVFDLIALTVMHIILLNFIFFCFNFMENIFVKY